MSQAWIRPDFDSTKWINLVANFTGQVSLGETF